MLTCTKFLSTDLSMYEAAMGSVFDRPEDIDEDAWDKLWFRSFTARYILYPLVNVHNNVMASDDFRAMKFLKVTVFAAGLVLGGVIGGGVEAIVRLAIGILTSPLFFFGRELAEVSEFIGFRAARDNFFQMGSGISLAFQCFAKAGNIEVLFEDPNSCD